MRNVARGVAVLLCMVMLGGCRGEAPRRRSAARPEAVALPEGARRMFEANGFVVLRDGEQNSLTEAYMELPGAPFITSDAVLYVFHCLFRGGLSAYERQRLLPLGEQLAARGLNAAREQAQARVGDPLLQEPTRRNVVLFAAAKTLLDGQPPTDEVEEVSEIVGKITEAQEAGFYPAEDYTVYAPRGVYASDPDLARYFRAMKWMSRVLLPIIPGRADVEPEAGIKLRQAYLLGLLLEQKPVGLAWHRLYDEVSFFIARPDSFTPKELRQATRRLPGFPSDAWVAAVRREFAKGEYPESKIEPGPQGMPGDSPRKYVQLMGERYIPDGQIHQETCFPHVRGRTVPKGLDVGYALFGSLRARTHLETECRRHPDLAPALERLHGEFGGYASEPEPGSIYAGWIGAVREVLLPPPSTHIAPFFHSDPWRDKSLTTALASWTQMRHDFVLYAKPAMVPGGGPSPHPALVEPVPKTYRRIAYLSEQLARRGFPGMRDLAELCEVLAEVAECESEGTDWADGDRIEPEWIMRLAGFGLWLLLHFSSQVAEEQPSVVVDVAADSNPPNLVLHEATGPFNLVIAQDHGAVYQGWVLSYYEFTEPHFTRLIDLQWQERVAKGQHHAARPSWVKSYMHQP